MPSGVFLRNKLFLLVVSVKNRRCCTSSPPMIPWNGSFLLGLVIWGSASRCLISESQGIEISGVDVIHGYSVGTTNASITIELLVPTTFLKGSLKVTQVSMLSLRLPETPNNCIGLMECSGNASPSRAPRTMSEYWAPVSRSMRISLTFPLGSDTCTITVSRNAGHKSLFLWFGLNGWPWWSRTKSELKIRALKTDATGVDSPSHNLSGGGTAAPAFRASLFCPWASLEAGTKGRSAGTGCLCSPPWFEVEPVEGRDFFWQRVVACL